ncbi:hypothetical protein BDR07DRAFT_1379141 [Suillus spraguei]|nr:hypothetical protein BDR07DRAFT_1379141 [Suillus spraguei]
MQQPEKPTKKPRLKHPDLAVSDLSLEEQQRERVRRWRANQKLDPKKVQETRGKEHANKREQRNARKKQHLRFSNPPTVEVMTDIPESLVDTNTLPNDRHPPSPTLSALTELDSHDLATPIIGSQVHAHSETIQWSDGSTTVLPCIMRNNVVHLQYSDWRTKSRQLCEEITAALRINKAVFIRRISKPEPATIDLEYLEDRGMSDLMRVVVHEFYVSTPKCNIGRIRKQYTRSQQDSVYTRLCIWTRGLPSCLSTLDSSIVNGWNQTTVDCPIGDRVHPDNFLVHSCKALELTDLYRNRENILDTWHGEIVTLLPGDMLPQAGENLTNQIHAHSLETFQRMIVNLPRISRRVKLYSRPLIALCLMVLDGNKYVAAGTEKPKLKTSTTTRAHEIASTVVKYFWKDLKTATNVYREKETNGSNNPMHPGQLITREELLSCLESFTTM